jgi:hypothetical protein
MKNVIVTSPEKYAKSVIPMVGWIRGTKKYHGDPIVVKEKRIKNDRTNARIAPRRKNTKINA